MVDAADLDRIDRVEGLHEVVVVEAVLKRVVGLLVGRVVAAAGGEAEREAEECDRERAKQTHE
jgi:hypothetical protein